MKSLQRQNFEDRLILKTPFSKVTADCSSLEECYIVFRLNCKVAQEEMQRDIPEELSSEF